MIIVNKKTGETLTIVDFRWKASYRKFTLEFDSTGVIAIDDPLSPFKNIIGTEGDDTLKAYYSGVTIHGQDGNDSITGNAGNDELYGDEGNDTLKGGDDVLCGGAGDDKLEGGSGDDSYVFGPGCGNDSITDGSGLNHLKFTDGIMPEDLEVLNSGSYNIVIKNNTTGDTLTIVDFRWKACYRSFTLEFDDGRTATISLDGGVHLVFDPLVEEESPVEEAVPDAVDVLNALYQNDALAADNNVVDEYSVTDSQVQNLVEAMSSFGTELKGVRFVYFGLLIRPNPASS